MLVVDSLQRCSHPWVWYGLVVGVIFTTMLQAEEGDQVIEGCLQRTCKTSVWVSSLVSNMCCYERVAYTINTTISSSMSEDGCVKAVINCVEETPGNAKMVVSMTNYCEDYATEDQVEELKEMLLKEMDPGSGCQSENEDKKEGTQF